MFVLFFYHSYFSQLEHFFFTDSVDRLFGFQSARVGYHRFQTWPYLCPPKCRKVRFSTFCSHLNSYSNHSQLPSDDNNVLSVLAYAVNYLGVENGAFPRQKSLSIDELIRIYSVIIVGHSNCGGAAASLKAVQNPKFVPEVPIITIDGEPADSPLNRWLQPLTLLAHSLHLPDQEEKALDMVVKENVKAQVENLANTETIINAWTHGTPQKQKVFIHGWVYDLGTGVLKDLGISRGPPN
jgi:carbonic anhydrase